MPPITSLQWRGDAGTSPDVGRLGILAPVWLPQNPVSQMRSSLRLLSASVRPFSLGSYWWVSS